MSRVLASAFVAILAVAVIALVPAAGSKAANLNGSAGNVFFSPTVFNIDVGGTHTWVSNTPNWDKNLPASGSSGTVAFNQAAFHSTVGFMASP